MVVVVEPGINHRAELFAGRGRGCAGLGGVLVELIPGMGTRSVRRHMGEPAVVGTHAGFDLGNVEIVPREVALDDPVHRTDLLFHFLKYPAHRIGWKPAAPVLEIIDRHSLNFQVARMGGVPFQEDNRASGAALRLLGCMALPESGFLMQADRVAEPRRFVEHNVEKRQRRLILALVPQRRPQMDEQRGDPRVARGFQLPADDAALPRIIGTEQWIADTVQIASPGGARLHFLNILAGRMLAENPEAAPVLPARRDFVLTVRRAPPDVPFAAVDRNVNLQLRRAFHRFVAGNGVTVPGQMGISRSSRSHQDEQQGKQKYRLFFHPHFLLQSFTSGMGT